MICVRSSPSEQLNAAQDDVQCFPPDAESRTDLDVPLVVVSPLFSISPMQDHLLSDRMSSKLHTVLIELHIVRCKICVIREQNVTMDILAKRLRERAEQLRISNAEAARRCELDERRYAHYASGRREPDLATLVRIAQKLGTTPNWLVGLSPDGTQGTERTQMLDRLRAAGAALPDDGLFALVIQAEALAASNLPNHERAD